MKNRQGFTLIELVAVMAIIGVLAAIVVPAVTGPQQASSAAEVKEGAFTVQSTSGDFFAAQDASEVLTSLTAAINATLNSDTDTSATTTQKKSTRWPETFLTDIATSTGTYAVEFRTPNTTTGSRVNTVVITDVDGAIITKSTLLEKFTAVDFDVLTDKDTTDSRALAYMTKRPEGAGLLTVGEFHNFLWLFEKTSTTAGTDDGRRVVVFSLLKAEEDSEASDSKPVTLTYEQIF